MRGWPLCSLRASVKVVIHCTATGSFLWLLPQQFQGDKPETWYIAILHGVNSRRQFCCSMHRGRVLVCRAAPWPVIQNIYVVLQRCWHWKKYYKKKEEQEEGVDEILVCAKQKMLGMSVKQSNFTLQIFISTKHGMLEEW